MDPRPPAGPLRNYWSPVYAAMATDSFNARMHGVLRDISRDMLSAVGDPMVAILVAGSYGEGRGRCLPTAGGLGSGIWSHGMAPADEVELVVVANASERVVSRLLNDIAQKYSQILQTGLRIALIIDENHLRRAQPSLGWFELVQSHQLLFGSEIIFADLRLRLGLPNDGCGTPSFHPNEFWHIHCRSGFSALSAIDQVAATDTGRFFASVRRLGDAIMLRNGPWDPDPDTRSTLVLHILSDDAWFRDHSERALALHELYRESLAYHTPTDRTVHSVDWSAYADGWLLVDEYLSSPNAGKNGPRPVQTIWRRYLRQAMRQLSEGARIPGTSRRHLLRTVGAWYYRHRL